MIVSLVSGFCGKRREHAGESWMMLMRSVFRVRLFRQPPGDGRRVERSPPLALIP